MFPYIRLFSPFRHYIVGFVFLTLVAYQASLAIQPTKTPLQTNDPRLADVVAYENMLSQKAQAILERSGASTYTIDLSVALDHTQITTTTFDPGDSSSPDNAGGVWLEEVTTSPRIRTIKVCITLTAEDGLDKMQLFESLSFALGLEPERGDKLRIAEF